MQKSAQTWKTVGRRVALTWTGEASGEVKLERILYPDPLCTDSSRIWVYSEDSLTQGWDFGIPDSSPVLLFSTSLNRPRLEFTADLRWQVATGGDPGSVKDTVTGNHIFQLSGKYARPTEVQWDGQYLVAGYRSGDVLILDFKCVPPQ